VIEAEPVIYRKNSRGSREQVDSSHLISGESRNNFNPTVDSSMGASIVCSTPLSDRTINRNHGEPGGCDPINLKSIANHGEAMETQSIAEPEVLVRPSFGLSQIDASSSSTSYEPVQNAPLYTQSPHDRHSYQPNSVDKCSLDNRTDVPALLYSSDQDDEMSSRCSSPEVDANSLQPVKFNVPVLIETPCTPEPPEHPSNGTSIDALQESTDGTEEPIAAEHTLSRRRKPKKRSNSGLPTPEDIGMFEQLTSKVLL
jgi:hypothetical protein